ncbi:hypothetical protein IA69_32150, partial [Massilia sp. JS1662]
MSSENASGELDYSWTPPADGDWSLLLASDGTKAAPGAVSMTFPNDTSTPWAIPLMVLGGLLILAGIALAVLSARTRNGDGDGNGNGKGSLFAKRARAKAEARSSSRLGMVGAGMVTAAVTAAVVAGTGVAANATTTPAPTTEPPASASEGAAAPSSPVLLDAQFRRILEQVS